jgi:hypothetical protein
MTTSISPTEAEIEAAKTPRGGWTRAQLAAWGIPWPPPKGWRQALIGAGRPAGPMDGDGPADPSTGGAR